MLRFLLPSKDACLHPTLYWVSGRVFQGKAPRPALP